MTIFNIGSVARVATAFTVAGVATDPAVVKFSYKPVSLGTATTLTYGTDVALVKDSTGNYHVDLDTSDYGGEWRWRFYSTGTAQSSEEGTFYVRPNAAVTTTVTASGLTDFQATSGSNIVGFIQSGSNAATRTVQDKLREIVSVSDFSGADTSLKLANAVAALPSVGGTVDCSMLSGNLPWSSTVALAARRVKIKFGECTLQPAITMFSVTTGSLEVEGAGWATTIIQPTNALVGTVLSLSGGSSTIQGWAVRKCYFDMSSAAAQTAIGLTGLTRPIVENVRIAYTSGAGLGIGISVATTGEARIEKVNIQSPGTGISINGDGGMNHLISDTLVEDAGTVGLTVTRTTTTDVGALHCVNFESTNPGARAGNQSIILTSSLANTTMPCFFITCTGDGAKGGPSMSVLNVNQIYLNGTWLTNAAVGGSNYAALKIDTQTECQIMGGLLQSASRDLEIAGVVTTLYVDGTKFSGTAKNIVLNSATLTICRIVPQYFNAATPLSAADAQAIAAAYNGMPISTAGGEIWTNSNASAAGAFFRLINKKSGDTNPSKNFNLSATGALQVWDNAATGLLFSLSNSGALSVAADLTGTHLVTTSGTPTVSAGQVGFGTTTQSTVGAAGGASALPATPSLYLQINVAGTTYVFPGYAVS